MTKKSVLKLTEYNDKDLNITAFTKDANIKQLDNYFYIYNNFSNLKFKYACSKSYKNFYTYKYK